VSCAITAGDMQQGAVTGSAIWTRVRLRQAAMFGFVPSVTMINFIVRYAMRKQSALGRFLTAVVAVGHESKVPLEVSTIGLGSASPYVRARAAGLWDRGLGAEIALPIGGGLCV